MVKNTEIASISLDGQSLALNFVNTVHNRRDDPLPDYLLSPADLIAWAEKASMLDEKRIRLLTNAMQSNIRKARVFFADALAMRELLYRMFFSVTLTETIAPDDLCQFNVRLQAHFSHLKLVATDSCYEQSWDLEGDDFQQFTAPIMKDACDLLLSDRLRRVKECPNCGWLFLDTTKNGKRRWCSMKNCGSGIKALGWYHRQKQRRTGEVG